MALSSYRRAVKHLRDISALEGISGLLGWDEMVMQPQGASQIKGAQKAALAGVIFDKKTDPQLGQLLKTLSADSSLSQVQRATVRIASAEYHRAVALPKEIAQRIAELETAGYHSWIAARTASDFELFKPSLQEWLDISLRKASLIDSSADAYDVLLEDYEVGMTSKRIDEIFGEVRAGLIPLIHDVRSRGTAPDGSCLEGIFDVEKQAELCESIALDLGFDLSSGRLDVSVHPFTGGSHPTDVRMTTRFKELDITEGLTGAIHETGHAIYEQGRNSSSEWADLPVNRALSMGVHESQSLLWERMVALSEPFQHYLLPKLREFFPAQIGASVTPEMLYGAVNIVKNPSLIRVESDELTYTMHIILRYEIERALVDGSLALDDLPAVWNSKMVEYLGVEVDSDAQGVLQDVHWSAGAIGYFPTYTLGAMIATQFFETAKSSIPDLDAKIAAGDFGPLKAWLNENVHQKGSLHANFDELLIDVTGKPLDPQIYLRYLRHKYSKLYKFNSTSSSL